MPHRMKKNRRQQKTESGSFRVIGGQHRSRRLQFPVLDSLRPTTDRVKETVFNWLSFNIEDASVLDLFAGSGALGIEAASRGAKMVQFVELNPQAAEALRGNCDLLGLAADVTRADAFQWLATYEGMPFDVVFLDPPFRKGVLDNLLQELNISKAISAGTRVYIEQEQEAKSAEIPINWKQLKEKTAGQVSYRMFEVAGVSE